MLVLTRAKDESIMIGDNIEILICDIRGDKVRLGITAPKDIPVHRREIYDRIREDRAELDNQLKRKEETDQIPDSES